MCLQGLLLKLERYGIKGNRLQWLGSYISAREQQVIIKNVISGKGNLKAGVPQGSILLFLIFINDIADEKIGLCRLFADDTSIGEKSYEMNSLCNMVNTDLNNISEWSKQWLVKLNPTKTRIYPVKCHKHLGITLSADCKFSNHINTIIEKNIQTSGSSAKT